MRTIEVLSSSSSSSFAHRIFSGTLQKIRTVKIPQSIFIFFASTLNVTAREGEHQQKKKDPIEQGKKMEETETERKGERVERERKKQHQ